jgi:hypothetical protein
LQFILQLAISVSAFCFGVLLQNLLAQCQFLEEFTGTN